MKLVKNGTSFEIMPFESHGNEMSGKYDYKSLETRLRTIKTHLANEAESWAVTGRNPAKSPAIAANLQLQFDQCTNYFGASPNGVTITLEMEKDNPFVWTLVYFGKPMTKWDEGVFTVRMIFPDTFPVEQPRVRILRSEEHTSELQSQSNL